MIQQALSEQRYKTCFKCNSYLPLDSFYKHSKMLDGHLNKCKECAKADVAKNREDKSEYYKAYDRVRSRSESRKERRKEYQTRDYVKQRMAAHRKAWDLKYPERRAASVAVGNALRTGMLSKLPCFICGTLDVEGHHPDYSAPLSVVWLCTKHHAEVHCDYDMEEDLKLLPNLTHRNL